MYKIVEIILIILSITNIVVALMYTIYILKQQKKYSMSIKETVGFMFYGVIVVMLEIVFMGLNPVGHKVWLMMLILCQFLLPYPYLPLLKILNEMIEKLSIDVEYEFLMRKSEVDKKCYMLMKNYEETMSKIRHDFMNQIQIAYMLAENSESEKETIKMIEALKDKIASTKVNAFCSNKTINIVCSMKNKELKEKSINLDTDIILNGEINIEEMDLCSIFMNVLDEVILLKNMSKNLGDRTQNCYLKCRKNDNLIIITFKTPSDIYDNNNEMQKVIKNYDRYFEGIVNKYNGTLYKKSINEMIITLENVVSI